MTPDELGQSLLAAVVAAIPDPPARRIFTVGAPTDPLKGEQVAVGFSRIFAGQPGQPRPGPDSICWAPNVAEFVVRVLRCFPTSTTEEDTDPAAIAATTTLVLADAQALRASLGLWAPHEVTNQGDVWVGDLIGYRPQGLAQALSTTVHVVT